MKAPELVFDFYSVKDIGNSFKFGKLYLRTMDKYLRFQATSGLLNHQRLSNCGERGRGGIPPCELVNIPAYSVSTKAIAMPKVRGVEGNFYQIFPHLNRVEINDGVYTRGDFGIHQDAGVLGTAGCVGITKGMHWKAFEMEMQELVKKGIGSISLFVPMGY